MGCQGCGFEAAAEFAFCPKCGSRLAAACPACDYACPPDFAFCPRCGARLAPAVAPPTEPAPTAEGRPDTLQEWAPDNAAAKARSTTEVGGAEGERRPVTVLFADLSGFTAFAEAHDCEDVAALLERCLGTMTEAVHRYEGVVDKYIGDCVMALFGAPAAHEDDPERAIRAALEMRERIDSINRDVGVASDGAGPPGEPRLALHAGINTGLVVAGAVGSASRREYTVLGDAVNVAARLESAAGDGEIVVGPQTYRLARHAFAFEPLGDLTLEGRTEPLPAYRVLGLLTAPRSARGLEAHGLATPLVGRDEELDQLLATFDRMLRGRTQVVSLIGEAGVGKSRLLREFFERLEADGRLDAPQVSVRRAACSSLGQQTYGVVAAFFRDAYGVALDDPPAMVQQKLVAGLAELGREAEEAAQTATLVGHVLGADSSDPRLRYVEPEQLKRQLFLAVRNVVELRLEQGPLLLVVEDLHWTDAASVELLRFLVDRLGDRRFMLLLTHRPTFDAGGLAGGRATHTAIRLSPLSPDESHTLLGALFGASAGRIPARLRDLIVARAGGSPFYLEEVLRALIEAGGLVREADDWICTADVATLDVPATVQAVLLARLDGLPPGARRFIQEAAVVGPVFGETLLRAVCSEPIAVGRHLDLLHEAELVDEVSRASGLPMPAERRHRFVHALIEEAAYQSLLVRRRTELHGRVAEALEAMCRGRPERLEDLEALGHHFSLSADRPKGARYLTAAGDWARAIYANEDAARHYRRALEVLSAWDPTRTERLTVRERLGDVLGPLGRREEALEYYTSVLNAYAEDGDRPAQARLRRRIGALHWDAGDREAALAHYRAGLALLEGHVEHIELAQLYQEMGRLAFRSGDNPQAISWAQRALALAEQLMAGTPECRQEAAAAIAHAQNTLGIALARTGALEEAVAHLEQSLAVAREHGLLQVACRAYTNLGVLYSTLDPGRAIEACLAGLELAKRIGDLGLQPWLYANLAGAYCTFTGQCEDEGIAAAQRAIELDRELGQLDHLAVPLIVLGQIQQCHGEPALALQYYQEALRLAEEMREPQLLFPCYDGLATVYLELDDEARAEQYMLKGRQVCEQAGLEPESLIVLPFLG